MFRSKGDPILVKTTEIDRLTELAGLSLIDVEKEVYRNRLGRILTFCRRLQQCNPTAPEEVEALPFSELSRQGSAVGDLVEIAFDTCISSDRLKDGMLLVCPEDDRQEKDRPSEERS